MARRLPYLCSRVLAVLHFAALSVCACAFCGCATAEKSPKRSNADSYTFAQKKLLEIAKEQNRFLEKLRNVSYLSTVVNSDLISEKKRLDSLWSAYFAGEERDAESYAIYGKFLRRTSDPTTAYRAFLKADSLDPTLASVKHQLAVYESENGQFKEAYGHFNAALALSPDNPTYLSQTAKFLMVARSELSESGDFDVAALDARMLECYRKWAELSPANSPARWEYAKAFYSVVKPDWNLALEVWRGVLADCTLSLERQTAMANIARVLIELRRDAEARALLEKVDNPFLADDKAKLLGVIDADAKQQTDTEK